ncbi:hypothetical protein [Parafilimonas terrae]|uniref:Uncharacterized protein n=1 Tax=Parafilimonas terrae TaxID=1465490 RepID=A0A1I5YDJ1_9BACT|nr:hypothetical protein [Parafilimonas terrae]SFQ42279.1 hypothetical protein SAMN05444277_111133 [Parafilimonas terrae]
MKPALLIFITLLFTNIRGISQDCKTTAELETAPGKYLTAAQYPWPAVRAAYFNKMNSAADKAMAKKILEQIEKTEQQTHAGFNFTGGNWENYFSTDGYDYFGNAKLGQYTFQAALHEYFCLKGKPSRNDEASTILRIYVNKIPVNTLIKFLDNPFGNSIDNDRDYGFQFLDWKNHKTTEPNAQLIPLFTFMTCNNAQLIDAINSGNNYFQDVAEKDIKLNNRNNYVYRYWFIKRKDIPVIIPVTRKEYLQSLLEYYEREKLHFAKLVPELTADRSSSVKYYSNWQADVADKIAMVKKTLAENKEEWLSEQAVINRIEDASLSYNAKLSEYTNRNRFWKFYGNENKSTPLYQYNPEYFKAAAQTAAKPQIISIAFRYVAMPSSLRILDNFTKQFDFEAVKKLVE